MPTLLVNIKRREIARFRVGGQRITIGRAPDSDVVLDNVGVSRKHASLLWREGGYWIMDEGSQNGVFLNGRRVQSGQVGPTDVVLVGKFTISLKPEEDDADPPMSSGPRQSARNPQRTLALGDADLQKIMAGAYQETTRHTIPPRVPRHLVGFAALAAVFAGLMLWWTLR